MPIVRVLIKEPSPPTEFDKQKFKEAALRELSTMNDAQEKIFCDEDCPELTDEQLERLMPIHFGEKFLMEKVNG